MKIPTCGYTRLMARYRYFNCLDALPDPSGPLSVLVSPEAIKDVNEAVRTATHAKPRGAYARFTPKQQAVIGEYTSLHDDQVAIRHFLKLLEVEWKVSSVQTWKGMSNSEISCKYLSCTANGKVARGLAKGSTLFPSS